MRAPKDRLWTSSFLLLWQGQLVSILGDVVYSVGLGFWILEATGSTAIMGFLMFVTSMARVAVSPIAGVVVDRTDRRRLMIFMDAIRGAGVVFVGVWGILGLLEVWMVFAVGAVLGACGAFFSPAASSAIPDITSKSKIVPANSVFAMIQTGGGMVGNPIGGFFYQAAGAPFLFLFNGISYLFSAACLLFARIPRVVHERRKNSFFSDLASGFSFVWTFRGLRTIIAVGAVINFFATMAMMIFIPFFKNNPALGPARYGIAMAVFIGGAFLSYAFTMAVKIPPSLRHLLFNVFGMSSMLLLALFPFVRIFPVVLLMLGIAGVGNGFLNVFIMATVQLAVPPDMRGKVFALLGMLMQGLVPVAQALGGIFAAYIPGEYLIFGCFAVTFIAGFPCLFLPSFKRFICFDPEKDTIESVA